MADAAAAATDATFVGDEVGTVIKDSIDEVLQNQQYEPRQVPQWTSSCLETCVRKLTNLQKPMKYIVTCVIMQKTGAGLCTACSCWWDNAMDGSRTFRWENKTMYCLVTVFGLAI
ncbi:unnamed protein product [Pedinophyceae sp. YPF-701]|nr:unnamed protein product [Pedinophyceae sp. YPF-701]